MSKKSWLIVLLTLTIIYIASPLASAITTPPVEETTDSGTLGTWSFGSGTYKKYGEDPFDSNTWTYSGRPEQVISYTFPSDGILEVNGHPDGNSLSPVVDLWVDGQRVSTWEMGLYYRGRLKQGQTLEFHVHPMYNAYKSEIIYDDPGNPPLIFEGVYDAQSGSATYTFESDNDSGNTDDYITASMYWTPNTPTTLDTLEVYSSIYTTGTVTSIIWFIDGELATELTSDSWTWENPPAGEHMITLIAKDNNGNTDQSTDYITVTDSGEPEITPKITFSPNNPTTDTPINFIDGSVILGVDGVTRYWYLDGYQVTKATDQVVWTWDEPTAGEHNIQLELHDGDQSYYTDLDFTVSPASDITVDIVASSTTAYLGTPFTVDTDIETTGTQINEIHWYLHDVSMNNLYKAETWTWTPPATGVYTISVSVIGEDGTYSSDSIQITVEDRPLVTALVTDKTGIPLREVGVSFASSSTLLDDIWTDTMGKVTFPNSPPLGNGLDYYIGVQFLDKPGTFILYDEQGSTTRPAMAVFGPYRFDSIQDYSLNVTVVDKPDKSKTPEIESHQEDLAEMYIRFYQAARFFDTEYIYTFNIKPLPIFTHVTSTNGVFFWENSIHPFGDPPTTNYPCIVVDLKRSDASQYDAPMNREWHEFSHYFMWDQYGMLPPSHYDVVNKEAVWLDKNHKGVENHCTSDSYTEAFAEFTPLFMQHIYGTRNSGLAFFGVGVHYSYPVEDTHIPYELNYDRDKWEELAISSLLYDLWDGIDAKDHDYIDLDYDDIMEILMWEHELDTFYRLNQTTGIVECIEEDGLTSTRHIWYLTDIFDVLHEEADVYELNPDHIDELFAYHGFYEDTDNSGGYSSGDVISADTDTISMRRSFEVGPDKTMTVRSSGTGELVVEVVFPPEFSDYDYYYSLPLESKEMDVGIVAPPEHYNATVYMTVYKDGDPSQDSYSFTSTEYWAKVETGNGVGSYSFKGSGSRLVSIGLLLGKIITVILIGLITLGYLRQKNIV